MKNVLTNTLALVGGAAVGAFVNQAANKMLASSTTTTSSGSAMKALVPAGTIVLGAFLVPKLIKSEMGKLAGAGMAAAGGLFLLNATVLKIPGLAGIGAAPIMRNTMKMQRTVGSAIGAQGFVNNAVNGVMDPETVGTVFTN
jgi:hypothetical protein